MRVYLTLEDTPKGIAIDGRYVPNGCTDHSADSLSVLVTIGLISQMKLMDQKGLLKVDIPSIRLSSSLGQR